MYTQDNEPYHELNKEDYQEPCCPFDTSQWKESGPQERIDIRRVTEKLDEFFYKKDFDGAKRLLDYWLNTAVETGDTSSEFRLENELMGLTRKLGQGDEAIRHAERALELSADESIAGSIAAATAFVNAGTVFKAFGRAEKSVPLFERALTIYKEELPEDDGRLAALYNNFALALTDLGRFEEALGYYRLALGIMENTPGGEADAAITYLNMADCEEAFLGLEDAIFHIEEYLEKARELLDSPDLSRDSYYSFVCEKCIPAFKYYGYISFAEELEKRL